MTSNQGNTDFQYFPRLSDIQKAGQVVAEVVVRTPCHLHEQLSNKYDAAIYLKREDLQTVRSYKVRGAFNKMAHIDRATLPKGVVCASAGNHAQGFAMSCNKMQVYGKIFMPVTTPSQKISQVKMFGGPLVDISLEGDTFDDAKQAAYAYVDATGATFVHPFDDPHVIEGQGTVGLEILSQLPVSPDFILAPIGGGGLAAGIAGVLHEMAPTTALIGVEPKGAAAMAESIRNGSNTTLPVIDPFIDGAAVRRVGELNFNICRKALKTVTVVPEGLACKTILELYNRDAIVIEPAAALSLAALPFHQDEIRGKSVVCIISGSNNDITRTEEIKERALLYEGRKHYFIVRFPQRAGALKEFVADVLGLHDDITHFEYTKKNSRERGSALVGIEVQKTEDFEPLVYRMKEKGFFGEYVNDNQVLMNMLV